MKLINFFLILLIAHLSACSSKSEVEVPEDIAQLENVSVFSHQDEAPDLILNKISSFGDTDDIFINRISTMDTDSNGRLFLADAGEGTIHVYEPDGTYSTSVGRKGEGPGEFNNLSRIRVYNDYLYALDTSKRIISVFNLQDLSYSRAFAIGEDEDSFTGFPRNFYPIDSGQFLILSSRFEGISPQRTELESKLETVLVDSQGTIVKEDLIELQPEIMLLNQNNNNIMIRSKPHSRSTIFTANRSGMLYSGYNDRIFIQKHDTEGQFHGGIYYDYKNLPLDKKKVLDEFDPDTRKMVQDAGLPDNRTAFTRLLTDTKNRIWISTNIEDPEFNEWWVLSSEGNRLATVTLPNQNTIAKVEDEYLYIEETSDLGLQEIVKYAYRF